MKWMVGIRVVLALLVAVVLPLGQVHCAALMVSRSGPAIVQAEHPDGDDDCCHESSPGPQSPLNPCCCDLMQLPSTTPPASIAIGADVSVFTSIAMIAMVAAIGADRSAGIGPELQARSGSPPNPSGDPESPRGPPLSV